MAKNKLIECTFTSVWDNGATVTSLCTYDLKTGAVDPMMTRNSPKASLEREYITITGEPVNNAEDDEEIIEVCTTCHEFVLKTAMNPA